MKNQMKMSALIIALITMFGISANAQQLTKQQVLDAWDGMTSMVVGTAKAMPAENYSWVPADGMKSFGLLVSHHVQGNYGFAPRIFGTSPLASKIEWDENNKDQVVKALEDSFAFMRNAMSQMSQEDLSEEIDVFGSKQTRTKAILILTSHVQREHGKAITYMRIKGIAPAATQSW